MSLALVTGLAMAVQSRVNGQLGTELDDSALAAVLSFGGGLLLLLLWLAVSRSMRAGVGRAVTAVRTGVLRPWHLLGGIAGGTYVLAQSVTVAVIGVAMFTVGVVAGQTVSGLLVDRAGLGPAGRQPTSWPRVAGALLTVLAVGGSLVGEFGAGSDPSRLWLLVLPCAAGAGMAVQQAFNGHVGAVSGSALAATLINFTAGTVMLVLAWIVSLLSRGGPQGWPTNPVLYLGGLVGIVFIATASVVVTWIGVLLLGLSSVAGQLIGSVVLDTFLPAGATQLTAATVIGCAVALVAIVIAGMGGRRPTGAALKQSGS
ncbi:DMT family transporter [Prauserella cavernicola]|uniref:DMT family transporter n=1 Tax=Prauserella cavernicola TaxID=2800127 RepID=UPI0027DBFF9D|nr:DMT family transporter [Prauserella cavernicola]